MINSLYLYLSFTEFIDQTRVAEGRTQAWADLPSAQHSAGLANLGHVQIRVRQKRGGCRVVHHLYFQVLPLPS